MKKKEFSTRQKARRSLQSENPKVGRLGKRPVVTPRIQEKQRQGVRERRRAGR